MEQELQTYTYINSDYRLSIPNDENKPMSPQETQAFILKTLEQSCKEGIEIDIKYVVQELLQPMKLQIEDFKYKFLTYTNNPDFKVNSSEQVADLLISRGVSPNIFYVGKSHKAKFNKSIIKTLQSTPQSEEITQLLNDILDYRKLLTAYGEITDDDFVSNLHHHPSDNSKGIINPEITLTDTTRYTFTKPFLSSFSTQMHKVLVAGENATYVSIDVKTQEPTLFFTGFLKCAPIKKVFDEHPYDRYLGIARFVLTQYELLEKITDHYKDLKSISELDYSHPYINFIKKSQNGTPIFKSSKKCLVPIIDYTNLNAYCSYNLVPAYRINKDMRNDFKFALVAGGYGASCFTLQLISGNFVGKIFYNFLKTLPELVSYKERIAKVLDVYLDVVYSSSKVSSEELLFDNAEFGNQTDPLASAVLTEMNRPLVSSNYISNTQLSDVYTSRPLLQATSLFGTVITINDIDSKKKRRDRNGYERALINMPVQTSGADVLRILISKFITWTMESNIPRTLAKIAFTKHDELVFKIDDSILEKFHAEFVPKCTILIEGCSPLYVKVSQGKTYTK